MTVAKNARFHVMQRDGFACQYCGAKAPDARLCVDHIIPVAKGGTDDMANLVTACFDCNAGKSDSDLAFIPGHILSEASTAYERSQYLRDRCAVMRPEFNLPSQPRDAPISLVDEIRDEREALDVSIKASCVPQGFVAKAIGVSHSYMSLMRSGNRPIPRHLVAPICLATGSNLLAQFIARKQEQGARADSLAAQLRNTTPTDLE